MSSLLDKLKTGQGCRKSLPQRTLEEILHAFLPSVSFQILQTTIFGSQNRHPKERNKHGHSALEALAPSGMYGVEISTGMKGRV